LKVENNVPVRLLRALGTRRRLQHAADAHRRPAGVRHGNVAGERPGGREQRQVWPRPVPAERGGLDAA
jgi:hypothetical protein